MKTTVLAIVLTATFHLCNAQVNPQPGYVLTWEGGTVRGVIDYRTDSHNASACKLFSTGKKEKEFGNEVNDTSIYRNHFSVMEKQNQDNEDFFISDELKDTVYLKPDVKPKYKEGVPNS